MPLSELLGPFSLGYVTCDIRSADDFTRRIAQSADRFVTLRENGEACIARIAADQLDVLVQPEVGMTPLSYLLAALRVAPVQCAGWGHPVTTGGDGVDAYFTCGAMEPADAAMRRVRSSASGAVW